MLFNLIRRLALREFKGKAFIGGTLECRIKRAGFDKWEFLWEKPVPNMIVNVALAWIAYLLMDDATPTSFTHGAIGTGVTAPVETNEALQNQILTRIAATRSRITTSKTNDTAKFVCLFTSDGTYAVTEYGTFTAATGGTMLNRVTFSAINVNDTDQIEFTYKAQVQRV